MGAAIQFISYTLSPLIARSSGMSYYPGSQYANSFGGTSRDSGTQTRSGRHSGMPGSENTEPHRSRLSGTRTGGHSKANLERELSDLRTKHERLGRRFDILWTEHATLQTEHATLRTMIDSLQEVYANLRGRVTAYENVENPQTMDRLENNRKLLLEQLREQLREQQRGAFTLQGTDMAGRNIWLKPNDDEQWTGRGHLGGHQQTDYSRHWEVVLRGTGQRWQYRGNGEWHVLRDTGWWRGQRQWQWSLVGNYDQVPGGDEETPWVDDSGSEGSVASSGSHSERGRRRRRKRRPRRGWVASLFGSKKSQGIPDIVDD